ncbi:MAG: NADH-quinone oxidoreductase subunit L [Pseudobdellovibrionaceae bacterium]
MNHSAVLAILLLAPLVGFAINGLRWRSHSPNVAGSIASFVALVSFVCSIILVVDLASMNEGARQILVKYFEWIVVGGLRVDAAFMVDPMSAIMILVITGVGSLIHIFSVGYMHHDEGAAKYFAYLNLFLFNMLLLVLGANLPVMFVGWEGVGLCSYLLIGFWFTDAEKAAAGMKAFITNRIGDAAFLLGMFILFLQFGTLGFQELNSMAPATAELGWSGPITMACLFLFIGATGKSAQIPLYVWLPDAMAGPTPVSALIHAATMVTAGVYMICRLNPLFMAAPNALLVVAIIGALTALMAASIGLTQWDIKKVLAYSTVSQLGYMFLAAGVGAFGFAMFHLMTHAFFKALMFLGSGSVIHAMDGEQDLRKMGGLKKYLPITHWTFFFGWIAIIGIPPFAGFMSKDEILWMAWHSPMGHKLFWVAGLFGAAMTAFYMTRLMCLTFWGQSRVPKSVHPHESPPTMTIPLIVLGILSIIGGWIGIPHVIAAVLPNHPPNILEHWLHPLITQIPGLAEAEASEEWMLMGISVAVASISAFVAYNFYVMAPGRSDRFVAKIKPVYELVYNKYFVDEFYYGRIINPLVTLSKNIWLYIDVNFIDKTTYWISDLVKGVGQTARTLQDGNTQTYAMYVSIGIVVALSVILMR